jgi:hypothetical protein
MLTGRRLSLRGPPEHPQLRRGRGSRAAVPSRRRSARVDVLRGTEWTHASLASGYPSPSSRNGRRLAADTSTSTSRTDNDVGSHARRTSETRSNVAPPTSTATASGERPPSRTLPGCSGAGSTGRGARRHCRSLTHRERNGRGGEGGRLDRV